MTIGEFIGNLIAVIFGVAMLVIQIGAPIAIIYIALKFAGVV